MNKHLDSCVIVDSGEKAVHRWRERAITAEVRVAELEGLRETTTYEGDKWGNWSCAKCGQVWELNEGTPSENRMDYCPRCGRRIVGGGE